jgi:DNA-binding HxlR family transcriptional regulator
MSDLDGPGSIPHPHRPVNGAIMSSMEGYGRYCPVAIGTDVLADRWTPLILRELFMGSVRFNEIARGLPGISRTLLSQRLKHLVNKGVLERWPTATGRGDEYRLTPAGEALQPVVIAIGAWSVEWMYSEFHPDEIDPQTLTWWLHRNVDVDRVPPGRTVMELHHTGPKRALVWLVIDRKEVSVCPRHPGYDVDVTLAFPTPVLANVFYGLDSWQRATRAGEITIDGPPRLVRAVPTWFRPSPFAAMLADRPSLTASTR